jgi:metal-dependent amidase/aminoacylase/carboxypeptidase family protein
MEEAAMERFNRLWIEAVLGAALTFGVSAQTVNQRRENQQDRIAQGVQSGSLTAGETANLEQKEAGINQEVRTDRSLDGGHLTQQEKNIVSGQQNAMSRQIYRDKHNAATQHYGNNEVDDRRENQQDRIANGIASGKLSAGQTARLEKKEAAVNQETRVDRKLNGGHLTGAEKNQINRQQNRLSKQIYRDKRS